MAKYIVFHTESEGNFEDYRERIVTSTFDDKEAAEIFVDNYPDATVVYGEICTIIKKHSEIIVEEQ